MDVQSENGDGKNERFNFILKLRFVPKALIVCKRLNVFYIVLLVTKKYILFLYPCLLFWSEVSRGKKKKFIVFIVLF